MTEIVDIKGGQEYTISHRLKAGQNKVPCPKCSHERKKKNDPSLSYNMAKGIGHCHHCDTSFVSKDSHTEFVRPKFINITSLSERVVKWFDSRGINQQTLAMMKIGEGKEYMPQTQKEENTIQFNYFRAGHLVNIKYRDGKKNFKMVKDAEKILYNVDAIHTGKQLIVCEGEMDALTLIQCGYANTVSVPNGASTGNNNMEYLDGAIDDMEHIEEFIFCTDNDTAGIALRDQLSARLGVERCSKVSYPSGGERECKDINEVLEKFGKHKVLECIDGRKPMPVDGVFTTDDFRDELYDLYLNGLKEGFKIGDHLDRRLTFEPGRMYMVTGIPGHGKSEFIDFVVERLNAEHGLKAGYFSPENHPVTLHISKLAEKISGSEFNHMDLPREVYDRVLDYMKDNFYFISPPDDFSMDTILGKARYLVLRHGIKILVVDPWNKIEHRIPAGQTETLYISDMLDKLLTFTKRNKVILFLVAHPRKLRKENGVYEVPTLYDISGSANFYNKTDFGLAVYRDFENKIISVHIQKIKFKHLGSEGVVQYTYDMRSGRFVPANASFEDSVVHAENLPF